MSNRVIFRFAVIGLLAFQIASGVALYYLDDGSLDSAWELLPEPIDWYGYFESHIVIAILASLSVVLVIVASLIGVLLFQSWGRWLYLSSTLLISPLSIITGPIIYFGWEIALWDILSMANGAIMLAMFLPPISNEFNKLSQQDATSSASA